MEKYHMTANFYPAAEPKNGYVGFADLTIANAIRIRGIGVFENREGDGCHIQFPEFGDGDNKISFVIPSSKEAYGQMLDVIENAVKDQEKHFAWSSGRMNPRLEVSGHAANDAYADGRYSIKVADVCTLRGVGTREVNYEKDGKSNSFISVDMPTLTPYEKDGEKVYPAVFEGLTSTYEKDGQAKSKDFGLLIRNLVIAERKNLLENEKRPSLAEQVASAEQKVGANGPSPETPAKTAER